MFVNRINKGNIINIELIKEKRILNFSFDLQIKDLKNFKLDKSDKQSNLNFKIIDTNRKIFIEIFEILKKLMLF